MCDTKQCAKCKEIKSVDEFYKKKQNKDGYHSYCKECVRATSRQYHKDNPEYVKEYYQRNKEKIKKQSIIHYFENKEYYQNYYKDYNKKQ